MEEYVAREMDLDDCFFIWQVKPTVIFGRNQLMESEVNTPRLPSYRRKKATDDSLIRSLTLADLQDSDPSHYGLKGSPTQVQKVYPPEKSSSRTMVKGSSAELSEKLFQLLSDRKFI